MKVKVIQLCPTLHDPMDCSLRGSSIHGILRQEYWKWWTMPSPGDLPYPGSKLGSPALQVVSLPSELPGKPVSSKMQLNSYTCCYTESFKNITCNIAPGKHPLYSYERASVKRANITLVLL